MYRSLLFLYTVLTFRNSESKMLEEIKLHYAVYFLSGK